MNDFIQLAYLISSSIGIMAMIPQIRQIVATKQSNELSLPTWVTWACCQVVSFIYASSIGATAYMFVGSIWIGFYTLMVILIIRYRKKRGLLEAISDWWNRKRYQKENLSYFTE